MKESEEVKMKSPYILPLAFFRLVYAAGQPSGWPKTLPTGTWI